MEVTAVVESPLGRNLLDWFIRTPKISGGPREACTQCKTAEANAKRLSEECTEAASSETAGFSGFIDFHDAVRFPYQFQCWLHSGQAAGVCRRSFVDRSDERQEEFVEAEPVQDFSIRISVLWICNDSLPITGDFLPMLP